MLVFRTTMETALNSESESVMGVFSAVKQLCRCFKVVVKCSTLKFSFDGYVEYCAALSGTNWNREMWGSCPVCRTVRIFLFNFFLHENNDCTITDVLSLNSLLHFLLIKLTHIIIFSPNIIENWLLSAWKFLLN